MTENLIQRHQLMEELLRRYGRHTSWREQLLYYRKRFAWNVVVGGAQTVKRLLDIVVSLILLLLLLPLFAVVALAIKAYDRGPVFYVTERVGKWGREFPFPKFRSMVLNADQLKEQLAARNQHADGVTFKMKKDPRITPLGRFLRRSSIDELPQLWCVLRGYMSLVGPRPPLPSEVSQYSLEERRRLDVKPGLTCIWQISGRGDIPFQEQVALDIEYINSRSLLLDLKVLLRTIPAVLTGRGAY